MENRWKKMPSVLFYDEIRWTKLNKIVILSYFPYNLKMKFRLEVLFKKFHPRINLTTLFLTKSHLLNTITIFRSWKPISKTFTRGVTLGTWTSKFWVCRTSSWLTCGREPKFQLSRSYGLGCRRGTNFCQRRRGGGGDGAWQTENCLLLFFTFYDFLSVKSKIWAKKKKIKIFGVKPILSYSTYDESKNRNEFRKFSTKFVYF
jgi:hypothetical protein